MFCSICKEKEATVHLTQISGDKMQKVDLCEECAKTKGVNDPAGFSLADLLLGLGASQEIEQAAGGVELKCPRCGFTQADFKKSGREEMACALEAACRVSGGRRRVAEYLEALFERPRDGEPSDRTALESSRQLSPPGSSTVNRRSYNRTSADTACAAETQWIVPFTFFPL